MTAIRRMARQGAGPKRLDLSEIKHAIMGGMIQGAQVAFGVVSPVDDGEKPWTIEEEDGIPVDVLVDVELMPGGSDVTARLGSLGSAAGYGIWALPPEGTEVALIVPQGEIDFMPIIICTLSSRRVPDRIGEDKLIIVAKERVEIIGEQVYISSDGAAGEPLCRKSDFIAHFHPTGVGPSGTPNNASTAGTTVLKAE